MKASNLVYFFVALNASAYILGLLVSLDVLVPIAGASAVYDPSDVTAQFALTNFSGQAIVAGVVGAGIIGVVGWITKQGIYAVFAMAIWLVGIFLNIFTFIITGMSSFFTALLPSEIAFMAGIFYGFIVISIFYALARTVSQNPSIGQ